MTARPVLRYPDPRLKQPCRELDFATEAAYVLVLAQDLLDTMEAGPRTVGIAAPQIGELVRLAVVDCSTHRKAVDDNHGRLVLVNPEIVSAEGSERGREGCLSIPDLTADVRRYTSICVCAFTAVGEPLEIDAGGFEARALQHEIDHLDGLLFLDRVTSLTRDVFPRKQYGP